MTRDTRNHSFSVVLRVVAAFFRALVTVSTLVAFVASAESLTGSDAEFADGDGSNGDESDCDGEGREESSPEANEYSVMRPTEMTVPGRRNRVEDGDPAHTACNRRLPIRGCPEDDFARALHRPPAA